MSLPVRVIEPAGLLDAASGHALRGEVIQAIAAGSTSILINMKGVTFMDSRCAARPLGGMAGERPLAGD
jgi:anti-anti-sigma factor